MGEPWEESEVPPGLGEIFGLNDENEMFHARLIKWVRVPSEIPFRQGIEKVQIGIFLDADDLPAYLKGTVRVVWVHNGKREARITLEIAELLASSRLTETDGGAIPVEPDRGVVWLTFRPNGGYMGQGGCVQQISIFLWNIYHQRVFPFIIRAALRSNQRRSIWPAQGPVKGLALAASPLYRTGWYVRMVTPPGSAVVSTRSRFTRFAPSLRKLLPFASRTG